MSKRVAEDDMMRGRLFEAELDALRSKTEAKAMEFQHWVDSLFGKYELVKGRDRLMPDGEIVRGEGK